MRNTSFCCQVVVIVVVDVVFSKWRCWKFYFLSKYFSFRVRCRFLLIFLLFFIFSFFFFFLQGNAICDALQRIPLFLLWFLSIDRERLIRLGWEELKGTDKAKLEKGEKKNNKSIHTHAQTRNTLER